MRAARRGIGMLLLAAVLELTDDGWKMRHLHTS